MNIELIELVENEDGSADIQLELDDDAKKLLIQLGFEKLLTDVINKYKEESNVT
jgi:hypothetical protein